MAKTKHEIERRPDNAAITAPSEYSRPFEMDGADDLEKMIPRIVLHQGKMSQKFWGKHPEGTFLDSVTGEPLASPVRFIPISINWVEFIRFGDNIGDPLVYRTRNRAEIEPSDLKWNDNEPPACVQIFNFVCLVPGRDLPIALSLRSSSKHQKKAAGALFQLEKTRAAAKRGPGLYELTSATTSNDKGEWMIPVIRPLGNPSDDLAALSLQFYRQYAGQEIAVHKDADQDADFNPEDVG